MNDNRHHRNLAAAAAATGAVLAALTVFVAYRILQTGFTARTVGAVFMIAFGLVAAGWTLARVILAWIADLRRPAITDPKPITPGRLRAVGLAVGHVIALDPAERATLAATYTRAAHTRRWRRLVDRVVDIASDHGRLHDHETGDDVGAEALTSVANVPGAYEAVLAVLTADIAHPDDITDLLGPWAAAHLEPPDLDDTEAPDPQLWTIP